MLIQHRIWNIWKLELKASITQNFRVERSSETKFQPIPRTLEIILYERVGKLICTIWNMTQGRPFGLRWILLSACKCRQEKSILLIPLSSQKFLTHISCWVFWRKGRNKKLTLGGVRHLERQMSKQIMSWWVWLEMIRVCVHNYWYLGTLIHTRRLFHTFLQFFNLVNPCRSSPPNTNDSFLNKQQEIITPHGGITRLSWVEFKLLLCPRRRG